MTTKEYPDTIGKALSRFRLAANALAEAQQEEKAARLAYVELVLDARGVPKVGQMIEWTPQGKPTKRGRVVARSLWNSPDAMNATVEFKIAPVLKAGEMGKPVRIYDLNRTAKLSDDQTGAL